MHVCARTRTRTHTHTHTHAHTHTHTHTHAHTHTHTHTYTHIYTHLCNGLESPWPSSRYSSFTDEQRVEMITSTSWNDRTTINTDAIVTPTLLSADTFTLHLLQFAICTVRGCWGQVALADQQYTMSCHYCHDDGTQKWSHWTALTELEQCFLEDVTIIILWSNGWQSTILSLLVMTNQPILSKGCKVLKQVAENHLIICKIIIFCEDWDHDKIIW